MRRVNKFALTLLAGILRRRGYVTMTVAEAERINNQAQHGRLALRATMILSALAPDKNYGILYSCASMKSQLGQDVFALWASDMKQQGFFVEFGAGDGVNLSNSYLLEKEFGWSGILAEPLPEYHEKLALNRTAALETSCVWHTSGETLDFVSVGYLSTVADFAESDMHAQSRADRPVFSVKTISLLDLLDSYQAPTLIDFLSIDTEGSEYAILSAFPFGEKYTIKAIACEHNYSHHRLDVARLLASKGYTQVGAGISEHDDWFVLNDA
jgi:FkbM family methyltransferase